MQFDLAFIFYSLNFSFKCKPIFLTIAVSKPFHRFVLSFYQFFHHLSKLTRKRKSNAHHLADLFNYNVFFVILMYRNKISGKYQRREKETEITDNTVFFLLSSRIVEKEKI